MHPVVAVEVLLVESNIVCKGDAASTYHKKNQSEGAGEMDQW